MGISPEKLVLFRNLAAFWIFGLCNNYAYVIMLSAAEDIMDQQQHKNSTVETECLEDIIEAKCSSVSTGAVLLADILPSLAIKLTFPFFMQRIPFGIRHAIVCILQVICYLMVAYSVSVSMSLTGVAFAAMGSGLGEISYLALSTHFPRSTISAWSSGTGGAGLIGSLAYAGLTEPHLANLSPKNACLVMLVVPIIFGVAYWFLMVVPETVHQVHVFEARTWVVPKTDLAVSSSCSTGKIPSDTAEVSTVSISVESRRSTIVAELESKVLTMKEKLSLVLAMLKYMLPLATVYFAEYLINQGLTELVYFDCKGGFHLSRHSQYRWYQVLYQLGVFLSRSSVNLFQLPMWILYILPVLQMINAIFFTFDAVYFFVPQIWIIFVLILYEGLLGGSSYVNTYNRLHQDVPANIREFCMPIVSMSDAIGITISGFTAIPLHNFVCNQQKYHI